MARDEFDLQVFDARFREIENAKNSFVVQAIIGSQEQHALFTGLTPKYLRHAYW
jgi:hypothetical protein